MHTSIHRRRVPSSEGAVSPSRSGSLDKAQLKNFLVDLNGGVEVPDKEVDWVRPAPSQGASSAPLGGASQETPPHRVLERGPPGTVLRAAAERVCTVRTGWILAPALSRSERAVVVGPLRQAKKDY